MFLAIFLISGYLLFIAEKQTKFLCLHNNNSTRPKTVKLNSFWLQKKYSLTAIYEPNEA